MKKLKDIYLRIRFKAACCLDNPWVFYPFELKDKYRVIMRKSGLWRVSVNNKTQLVLDGFPSSANSYIERVLHQASDNKLKVASHFHSPIMILKAMKYNIPVVVCIRNPLDASVSACRRFGVFDVTGWLKIYLRFYQCIEPYADKLIIAHFDDVIKDVSNLLTVLTRQENFDQHLETNNLNLLIAERPNLGSFTEIKKQKEMEKDGAIQIRKKWDEQPDYDLLNKCNQLYKKILSVSKSGGVEYIQ